MMSKRLLLLLSFLLLSVYSVSAATGSIDQTNKYAWGEKTGWVNFGVTPTMVSVSDSAITGYAWSDNYGWIILNPSNAGVKNNGKGNLSGHAWAEGLGYIDFSGVTIDNTGGEFLGYATVLSDNSKISFNCANTASCNTVNFKVETNWPGGRGGGGTAPPAALVGPSGVMATTTTSTKSSVKPRFTFKRSLFRGLRGDDVKELQKFLAGDKTLYPEGLVTGYFGPLTRGAVQRFQAKHGIVSSGNEFTTGYGRVGPKTRQKLNELLPR